MECTNFLRHGDDLDRALFGAGAAIGALFGIDGGEEIGDGDGAGGANLGAHHAADAAGGADLADDIFELRGHHFGALR